MKRIISLLLILVAATMPLAVFAQHRSPLWEVVEVRDVVPTGDNESIEIETRDGHIYITTPRTIEVNVYTILGQLITKKKISAGTSRLTLGTKGVYILKTETLTRRINL